MEQKNIVIIGAGLSGLTLAYLLKKQNIDAHILEARSRIGGRILTVCNKNSTPLDMGATWLGKKHKSLNRLLSELDIGIFGQILGKRAIYEPMSLSPHQLVDLPPNHDPSFRIRGGSSTVINALNSALNQDYVHLNTQVTKIVAQEKSIDVLTKEKTYSASILVSTIPPYLFSKSITADWSEFEQVKQTMNQTHTWMGDSIKIGLGFDQAFWRSEDSSGTIFSNVGPIPEMYDHADYESSSFGLIGFLNGSYYSISKEERLAMILAQLEKYYGKIVRNYTCYEELVWANEPFTFSSYDAHILPHQNNGHPSFKNPIFNKRLFISGSETANSYPGYMDGAVESAQYVFDEIMKNT